MRTVKQVSDLTGISVRTLHYYDQIGLLKPSEITAAGYRLYSDKELETLQQILFFRELELPLKEVKEVLTSPSFDKRKALADQRKLLTLKRNRLDDLIELINKTLQGDNTMSFREFDMSAYYEVLDEFKREHEDRVIRMYGSLDKYNEFIEICRSKEAEIAEQAIKQYGSIEKYASAMKQNLNSDMITLAEQFDNFKKDCLEDKHPRLKELFQALTADISRNPASEEIQQLAEELTHTARNDYDLFRTEQRDSYWYAMVQCYLVNPEWIEQIDKKYRIGASKYIGEALKKYQGEKQPMLQILYKKLTADLSKNPASEELQQLVREIVAVSIEEHKQLNIDMGENYWGYMAELYLSKPGYTKAIDKEYGDGAANFIGTALKSYSEHIK